MTREVTRKEAIKIMEDLKSVVSSEDYKEAFSMAIEDYRRILDIAIEQCKADGCNGCAFIDTEEWEEPCRRCARNCKDYWRAGYQE